MNRAGSTAFPRLALTLATVAALGACQMSPGTGTATTGAPGDQSAPAAATDGPSSRTIERDVEAPEVFQRDDTGLWDGRPSLGGVWVAHPSAQDPERVMIRNQATGATVIGALFRRERDNPGPRFQISSEAANALGILAGAPTEISVTALRLQRVEMEIDPAPSATTAADETLAIAAAESPAAVDAAAGDAAAPAPTGAPQGQVAVTDADPEPPRRTLRDFFRRRSPEPAPADTAIAQTTLAPATAATTATAAQTVTEMASTEPPRAERRSFFDMFRRNRPEPEPDTTMIALPETTAAAPVATPEPPSRPAARIDRPFVQIGIFSVEQNATNARALMQRNGLTAEIRRGRINDNQFWRVVVGPAGSTAERADILRRVRGLGFADAYAVVR
ncbi:MAG: SPOR domain-containing protein [Rhodobacter sp.]|nr:SPOR domain-containing protein [Paracoccaceae bacterium]MCC0079200.1 SPOR domain-containing protein [Rhodobacter sp.]